MKSKVRENIDNILDRGEKGEQLPKDDKALLRHYLMASVCSTSSEMFRYHTHRRLDRIRRLQGSQIAFVVQPTKRSVVKDIRDIHMNISEIFGGDKRERFSIFSDKIHKWVNIINDYYMSEMIRKYGSEFKKVTTRILDLSVSAHRMVMSAHRRNADLWNTLGVYMTESEIQILADDIDKTVEIVARNNILQPLISAGVIPFPENK